MSEDEFDDRDAARGSLSKEPEGGEHTRESQPAAKKSSLKEPKERAPASEANIEELYPGLTEQIRLFVEADLPPCPYCGSESTASVQVGMTGRAAAIADATPKVKLVPSAKEKLGAYFCNVCGKYFNE